MSSLQAWEAPALLSGRLWASLVTLWLTAQNRTVPKTPTLCFSLSISLSFIRFKLLSSFQPSLGSHSISPLATVHFSLSSFVSRHFLLPVSLLSGILSDFSLFSLLVLPTALLFYSSNHSFIFHSLLALSISPQD